MGCGWVGIRGRGKCGKCLGGRFIEVEIWPCIIKRPRPGIHFPQGVSYRASCSCIIMWVPNCACSGSSHYTISYTSCIHLVMFDARYSKHFVHNYAKIIYRRNTRTKSNVASQRTKTVIIPIDIKILCSVYPAKTPKRQPNMLAR